MVVDLGARRTSVRRRGTMVYQPIPGHHYLCIDCGLLALHVGSDLQSRRQSGKSHGFDTDWYIMNGEGGAIEEGRANGGGE